MHRGYLKTGPAGPVFAGCSVGFRRKKDQAVFCPALAFAHRARCASAIRFRPAADKVRFFAIETTFLFGPRSFLIFAQRALCAAAIRALPAADNLRTPFVPFA
jgi:hypothetical protein